ncbi:hypothetical protein D1007_51207 [Hordeum vulgare]|nr:hypothetical protein D1007_51207 [Hordeum vulgare]
MQRQHCALEEIAARRRDREEDDIVILDDSDEEAPGLSNPEYTWHPSSPAPVEEKVCDVHMLNRELIVSHESTSKALGKLNSLLQKKKDDIINDKSDLYDKTLRPKDQKNNLVEEGIS